MRSRGRGHGRGHGRKAVSGGASQDEGDTHGSKGSTAEWQLVQYVGTTAQHPSVSTMSKAVPETDVPEDMQEAFLSSVNTVHEEAETRSGTELDTEIDARASCDGHTEDALFISEELKLELQQLSARMADALAHAVRREIVKDTKGNTFAAAQEAKARHREAESMMEDLASAMDADLAAIDSDTEEAALRAQLESAQVLGMVHNAFGTNNNALDEEPRFGLIFESMHEAQMYVSRVALKSAPFRVWQGGTKNHRAWVCGSEHSAAGRRILKDERKSKDEDRNEVSLPPHRRSQRCVQMMKSSGCKALLEVQLVSGKALMNGSYRRTGFHVVCPFPLYSLP